MMLNRFIAIEGIDGSGKSTQISLLQRRLESTGQGVKIMHFPRYDCPIYGDLVARFLRGEFGDVDSVNPYLVSLLYAGDRQDAAPMILSWLKAGHVVLVDRYFYSNAAFQLAKINDPRGKREFAAWLETLEFGHNRIPRPDTSVFLNVPLDFALANLAAHRLGDDRSYLQGCRDIHEDSTALQRQVLDEYLWLTKSAPDFAKVDCWDASGLVLTPEETHARIWTLLGNGVAT